MNNLKWWQSAAIGAVGGLALALLKLIDAKFFLSSAATVEAYAGYLTYFCYIVLGSLTAVFLADHELPPAKTKRSAFVLGLLAPSVLLAIANQPARVADTERRQATIPALSWLPLSSAIAQSTKPVVPAMAAASQPTVEILQAASLSPSFSNALAAAVGRGNLNEPYAYVVGSTTDMGKAMETAWRMQKVLDSSASVSARPKVVQVEGGSTYFVLVGGLASREELRKVRLQATSTAINSIDVASRVPSASLADQKAVADLLVNAPIVPANALAIQSK